MSEIGVRAQINARLSNVDFLDKWALFTWKINTKQSSLPLSFPALWFHNLLIIVYIISPMTRCGFRFAAKLSTWAVTSTYLGRIRERYLFVPTAFSEIRPVGIHSSPDQTPFAVLQLEGTPKSCTRGRWLDRPNIWLWRLIISRKPNIDQCRVLTAWRHIKLRSPVYPIVKDGRAGNFIRLFEWFCF